MASESRKAVFAALAGNVAIAVTKFIAAAFTGSSAMLSEGIHSTVDTGNQVLLLLGMNRAKQPPSEQFPFGHGKEIYFWSFVVSIMIFAVGAGVSIYEGILHIAHPTMLENPLVSYLVLAAAFAFESFSWYFAFSGFRKEKGSRGFLEAVHYGKDPTLFVVLFEDSAALLGLIAAAAGVVLTETTGKPVYDGAASIAIGLILTAAASALAYETHSLLIGESAAKDIVQGIRKLASGYREIVNVNEILTMHMGPEYILVNLSVDFDDAVPASAVESTVAALDKEIKQAYPLVQRVFVEAENRT